MEILSIMVDQLSEIYEKANQYFEDLRKQMSFHDLQIEDMLHYIEFSKFNAAEGYIIAKIIKDLRQKRRKTKCELELAQSMIPIFQKNQIELEKLKNNLYKRMHDQINKKYTPRVLNFSILPGNIYRNICSK